MKAKFSSKSVIALILSLLMVISMVTIGIVTASSAKVEVAETGASTMEVYFTKPRSGWGEVKIHYWGGASSSSWPGVNMSMKYTNDYGEDVYYTTIPSDSTGLLFHNGNGTQSNDVTDIAGKQVVAYYLDGSTAKSWTEIPAPSGSGSGGGDTTPTAPPVVGEKTRLAIADATSERWLGNDDARFKVVVNGASTDMTKSVDIASGLTTWYCDVAKINSGTSISFKRCSALDGTAFNTWSTNYVAGSPLYKAKDATEVEAAAMLDLPDGSATNFGYGIWVDPKGDGDTTNFIKIYATDFVNSTDYYLYLPGFVDMTALKVYTNFPTLSIGGVSVTKGQVNTLNIGTAASKAISFKRNTSGSVHNGTLHFVKSSAAAMFMNTAKELYTGLAAAYAANEDGTANYPGAAAYKEQTSTKGTYNFYLKDGTKANTDTGLKKIKGRGNSTFEASMRLYGKYAYNVTLNEKAQLIDGCKASKKYSLLANNADESLVRNVTVYGIADQIGMPYTPNTRLIDLYDNGNYLGAYVITEKVEYGKNTLISDAQSLDKFNEDILAVGKNIDYDGLKQREATYTAKSGTTYTYQYSYNPSGAAYEFDGTTVTIGEGEDAEVYTLNEETMKQYDFLVEHELATRYKPEATWFVSNRTKQAVVPKYPEFATQKEVQWMIEQYDALETAVYASDYSSFAALADVESFASVYLIQELTMNLDAAATSYNILGGHSYPKLLAAPLWDYDWAAGMYNGKKLIALTGEVDVSDFNKEFVKHKSVKIDSTDGRDQSKYNLQAKLAHNSQFWNECKRIWTNKFVPVLNDYLGDGKTLLGSTLPEFRAAANMNDSRWNHLLKRLNDAAKAGNGADFWGTRSTSTYGRKSDNSSFGIGTYLATGSNTVNYDNTVLYLNDWLQKRQTYMSNTMKLYDASMIETEPATEPPTDAPTTPPTAPATEPATDAPTGDSETYLLGDTDLDGEVTILDATAIQRYIADYSVSTFDGICADADLDGLISIVDATSIQRFVADYTVSTPIGELLPLD